VVQDNLINRKRASRIYREEGPQVRTKKRKKLVRRKLPKTLVCDYGPEFTSKATFFWAKRTGVSDFLCARHTMTNKESVCQARRSRRRLS
jgi:hypothetical protein